LGIQPNGQPVRNEFFTAVWVNGETIFIVGGINAETTETVSRY
jgi:hypothetical protein